MAEIVNLRTARKRVARERKSALAEQNRILHGEKPADLAARRLQAERDRQLVEGHRRDRTDPSE